jgi:thiol-disulfide isomerase/thioredoxin
MFRSRNAAGLAVLLLAATVSWPLPAADEKREPADAKTAGQADPFAVPDGAPKDLADFIKRLRPQLTRDVETATKAQKAILKAADKILAAKGNEEEIQFAVQAKMNMLQDERQLAAFAEELQKGGHANLAREVRGFTLQVELRRATTAGPEQKKQAIAHAILFLEATPPQPADVGLAFAAGRLAETVGDTPLAVKTYGSLAKVFAASKDERLVEFAKTLEGVVRRIDLVGNEMKIEGKLLGGAAFDWSKHVGRVVLVDFWATSCGPCVAEIPNMKRCYDLYHDRGFDIVGLSCDRYLADVEKFVTEKKIPWPIVFGDGKPSPTVSYYGIMAIPTMVLVGKDGKVVSLNARGEKLKQELTKLLGPAEQKKLDTAKKN